jgi:hypothetical protein
MYVGRRLTKDSSHNKSCIQNHANGDGDVVPSKMSKPDSSVEAQDDGDQSQRAE